VGDYGPRSVDAKSTGFLSIKLISHRLNTGFSINEILCMTALLGSVLWGNTNLADGMVKNCTSPLRWRPSKGSQVRSVFQRDHYGSIAILTTKFLSLSLLLNTPGQVKLLHPLFIHCLDHLSHDLQAQAGETDTFPHDHTAGVFYLLFMNRFDGLHFVNGRGTTSQNPKLR
jgi:hypothetical protein